MNIMTVKEAAKKWGVAPRRVNEYIRDERIASAYKIGTTWVMPADTRKPIDKRLERKANLQTPINSQPAAALDALSQSFQTMLGNKDFMFQVLDMFPLPIEVFAPDGLAVYINRTLMNFLGQSDTTATVGKYNILNDPVCDEIFGHETLEKMMRGEPVIVNNFPVPVQDQVERGVSDEKPFEAAYMDVHSIPVWDGGTLAYVVCVFIPKQVYQGRAEMRKAQKYMEQNWFDDFDSAKLAKAANLSVHHFNRLFKSHMGMSPYERYKQIKIERLQEKLRDPNLNITQAFAACGVDSTGAFFRLFKESVGMTPSEYREQNINAK